MTAKEFVEEGLRQGLITILVSIDVKAAFDAGWKPSILKTLKDFNCPRNLYHITRSYFSQRTAVMSTNTVKGRKRSEQRMSTVILLRTRILEYSIQLPS
jgi:hypothetical protein